MLAVPTDNFMEWSAMSTVSALDHKFAQRIWGKLQESERHSLFASHPEELLHSQATYVWHAYRLELFFPEMLIACLTQ